MDRNPQIMVFGSHSPAGGESDYEGALELGRALAEAGFDVASGGYGGTMEAVLKGAREAGREGVGYTAHIFAAAPNRFVGREIGSEGLLERIERMIDDSDGFVVLRGGTGTLSELALCWELVNKKLVPRKPIVCLGEFWRPLIGLLTGEPSVESVESLRPEGRSAADFIRFAAGPAEAVRILKGELEA